MLRRLDLQVRSENVDLQLERKIESYERNKRMGMKQCNDSIIHQEKMKNRKET